MPKEIILETMSDEVKQQRIENLKNAREARAKKEELKNNLEFKETVMYRVRDNQRNDSN